MEILCLVFYILVFPGILFSIGIGILLAGIDRKLVARMQGRIGPPILQPLYDFLKLIGKDTIIPKGAAKNTFLIAPIIGFIAVGILNAFIPIFGNGFISGVADIIVIIYLLTIPAVAMIVGGASSSSPFAGIGISREMVTMIAYELPLVMVLIAIGKKAGEMFNGGVTFALLDIQNYQALYGSMLGKIALIPAAIAFLIIIPAEVGVPPFDVAEAETEICEGPLVEYSGLYLGIFNLTKNVKIFTMSNLFIALFLGGLGVNFGAVTINIILNIIILLILSVVITAISISLSKTIAGRLRVEQTLKFFWTIPTALAAISLILVYTGF